MEIYTEWLRVYLSVESRSSARSDLLTWVVLIGPPNWLDDPTGSIDMIVQTSFPKNNKRV